MNKIDVLFINPGNSKELYQDLSSKYSAIEPPTWALLLSEACRVKGFSVKILDVNAERLSHNEVADRILKYNPKLICFVVYGQNVNAGTAGMSGATRLSKFIKDSGIGQPISFVGSHVQALPTLTLEKEQSIDFVFTNEGVYSLLNVLSGDINIDRLRNINGIAYRENGVPIMTPPERVVPQERMDIDLPGYAWDLLPYKKKPFDLYRSPMWHAEYDQEKRTPYAAIQTSIGCSFSCDFCMINIVNRNDTEKIGVASNYSGMRYWSPDFIINEFDKLITYGVKTIRIVDEMFLLNPRHFKPLLELLAMRNVGDDLRMWAYSRVDTVKNPDVLQLVRKAGIKWLAIGIESADKSIRIETSKGKYEDINIRGVVDLIHKADIGVMANYIFGLPSDNFDSMQKTLDLSVELCTIGWNAYPAIPLPGTKLYSDAIDKGLELPSSYDAYSFHSYNASPLETEELSPADILRFRDHAFVVYHTNHSFLDKVSHTYGNNIVDNILNMTKVKLRRRLIEEDEHNV